MALTSGTKLGPYEILTPLGAGGMGEVYRARDSRLDRIVAVKVLPASFAADVEHGDDVRVTESGSGPRLLLEAGHRHGIDGPVGRDHLDGHVAPEPRIARPIHLAHPSGANLRNDFVDAEARAGWESQTG